MSGMALLSLTSQSWLSGKDQVYKTTNASIQVYTQNHRMEGGGGEGGDYTWKNLEKKWTQF